VAKPEIWVIDTSSILQVRRVVAKTQQNKVFTALGALVAEGKLVFPSQVFSELDRNSDPDDPADKPHAWAKKHKAYATRHGVDLLIVKAILAHPQIAKIIDPDKAGVEEADPYVLGLARQLGGDHDVTVLCEETRDRPDKLSMTSGCGLLRIVSLRMEPFMSLKGIWP